MKKFALIFSMLFLFSCSFSLEINNDEQNTTVKTEELEVIDDTSALSSEETPQTYLSFELDSVKYTVTNAQVRPFVEFSSNYKENGETNLSFMGPVKENSDLGISVAITFSGKTKGLFTGTLNPVPFTNPLFNIGISEHENNVSTTFVSSSETDGAPFTLEITQFDEEKIQGNFSGILSELSIEGLNLENKRSIENGTFSIIIK